MTGEFHAQKASNAEIVSIWWRHHAGTGIGTGIDNRIGTGTGIETIMVLHFSNDVFMILVNPPVANHYKLQWSESWVNTFLDVSHVDFMKWYYIDVSFHDYVKW